MDLKYPEILKQNNELKKTFYGKPYNIVILSNIIVSQLKEILEFNLRLEGIAAEVQFGNYDNILQDSQKINKSNLVIVFWELGNLIDGFH